MAGAVLITGASSGIGLECAIRLAHRGYRVVATMRDPARATALKEAAAAAQVSIAVQALDVTDPHSIEQAVRAVMGEYGGIDVLINNAGIQIRGYFEDISESEIRRVFETNVFGMMAVTRAVLPHMRAAKRGRILFVTSVGGKIGSPGLSAYCSSKFAMEGFGETLALEVAPFGIHVSLVEPGIINTEIWQRNLMIAEGSHQPSSPYRAFFRETERMAEWAVKTSPIRASHVADAVLHAIRSDRPKLRYLIGYRPAILLTIRRLVPQAWFDRVYRGIIANRIARGRAA